MTDRLLEDGVRLFADAADKLLGRGGAASAHAVLGRRLNTQSCKLGQGARDRRQATLEALARRRQGPPPVAGGRLAVDRRRRGRVARLADIVDEQLERVDQLDAFAAGRAARGLHRRRCCSAWAARASAPRCWRRPSARSPGLPRLHVLDSTDPAQLRGVEDADRPQRDTLFIVSSKSGTHARAEHPQALFLRASRAGARRRTRPAAHSSRSPIPARRSRRSRERSASAASSSARRASAAATRCCRDFGLVPAAAIGHRRRGACCRPRERDGALVRAERAAGRESRRAARRDPRRRGHAGPRQGDAHRLAAASPISAPGSSSSSPSRPASTAGADPGRRRAARARPTVYGDDRVFVYLRLDERAPTRHRTRRSTRSSRPAIRSCASRCRIAGQIGQEFFRWEIATAVAGAIIGINPFDQPDVEASKVKTRELTAAYREDRRAAGRDAGLRGSTASCGLRRRGATRAALKKAGADGARQLAEGAFRSRAARRLRRAARLSRRATSAISRRCRTCASRVRDQRRVATCARLRAALPAFDRPGLQGRPEQRRLPADHLR